MRSKFLVILVGIFLSSCGNFIEKKADTEEDGLNQENSVIDFATVQSAIFTPRCVSCHQQYSTYSGVKNELGAISIAIASDRMPKSGGPLSEDLKKLLEEWVNAGAPEFKGEAPGNDQPIVLEPTWKSISENILYPRCTVCHNPNGQAKFLDLSTRQAIFTQRDREFGDGRRLLDFNNPDNSYLFEVIQDPAEPMPPLWSNIKPLNQEEVSVLKNWVGLGLP